jgi:hypothetical protein
VQKTDTKLKFKIMSGSACRNMFNNADIGVSSRSICSIFISLGDSKLNLTDIKDSNLCIELDPQPFCSCYCTLLIVL